MHYENFITLPKAAKTLDNASVNFVSQTFAMTSQKTIVLIATFSLYETNIADLGSLKRFTCFPK